MQELKKMIIWHCWNHRKNRDGKWTKVPVAASGAPTGTDEAHRNTLVAFEEAERAVLEKNYSGVGFVIPAGIFMLDIDHKDLNDPLVRKLLERFHMTYAEISVSGHGAHIIGKCDLSRLPTYIDDDGNLRLSREFYQKNTRIGIELYIGGLTNRYSTYSGKAINDVPLQDCTEAILETLDQDMRRPGAVKPATVQKLAQATSGQIQEDDSAPKRSQEELEAEAFDIITALSNQKNGPKFKRLFFNGDRTGYKSDSEAEAGLCSLIAYRTGDDAELIEYIVNKSALNRDKWASRADYRRNTIRFAIQQYQGRFHPSKTEHPYFIVFNKKGTPSLEPSLLARYVRETVHYILVRDSAMQTVMPFVYEDGFFSLYDQKMFLGKIKEPVMEYDEIFVKMPKITETYNQLMTDKATATQEDLNADESFICLQNGLLKITATELTLQEHTPEVICTNQIPCDWTGKEVDTPVFDRFLDELTSGDKELQELILEFFGVAISNIKGYRIKKALFLVGPGNTGKSALKSFMEKLLGKGNYMGSDLQDLEARFGTSSAYGRRLVGSSDMSYLTVDELNTFKKMTGGDSLHAEFKGQQIFEYVYQGVLCFCMNSLPRFGGDDGKWVYDRILPVRCTNVIPEDKQDKNLQEKLYAEREGIVCKLVKAAQRVIANGYRLIEPAAIVEARNEYVKENNSVIGFFTECMCRKDDEKYSERHTITAIYSIYRDYCNLNNNGHAKTMADFRKRIALHLGITVKELMWHNDRGSIFRNYDLTEATVREYGPLAA